MDRSDFVLSGTTVGRTDTIRRLATDGTRQQPGWTSSADLVGWVIAVDDVWKGAAADTVVVYTAALGASCGYPFEVDEQYLIYGRLVATSDLGPSYDIEQVEPAELRRVSLCSRTRTMSRAAADLDELPPPSRRRDRGAD